MQTKMKAFLIAGAAAFAFGAAAIAQVIPQVQIINPNDLIQVIPRGQPSAQNRYATPNQITSQMGYKKFSPATGFQYTFSNTDSMIVLTNFTTVAAGSITFAAAPSDGAQECVYAQNQVTALQFIVGASNQTINNAATQITAAGKICYLFSLSNNTWDRSR